MLPHLPVVADLSHVIEGGVITGTDYFSRGEHRSQRRSEVVGLRRCHAERNWKDDFIQAMIEASTKAWDLLIQSTVMKTK